jgi:hypothetical protein
MGDQKQTIPGTADKYGLGNLTETADKELFERLEGLLDADPEEEDSEGDFINCQKEIKVIENELNYRRQYGASK